MNIIEFLNIAMTILLPSLLIAITITMIIYRGK